MSKIYAITPIFPWKMSQLKKLLDEGISLVQYREKKLTGNAKRQKALAIKTMCDEYQVPLIINDDVTLARQIDASGVHLGVDDMPINQAREILGPQALIGATCHNQIVRAHRAVELGANMVAFGAIYPSSTKPNAPRASIEILQQAKKELSVPIIAIGGITRAHLHTPLSDTVDWLAMSADLFSGPPPSRG